MEKPAPTARASLVKELIDQLTFDAQHRRLELPSLPDIALRLRKAVADDRIGVSEVARLVQADPSLALRVVQVANSARFAAMQRVDSTQAAVARIGLAQVRDLITSLSLRSLYAARTPEVAKRMKALWRHSVRVAATARVLAGLGPQLDPERGTLAGLIHDIGVIPVLGYAQRYPALLADPPLLDHVIQRLRGRIGTLVLRGWEFDDELAHVPLAVDNWTRNPRQRPDYGDVAMLANIFAGFGHEAYAGPPLNELPAFRKFALGVLGPEGGLEVLELARDEINATVQLLQGPG